MGEDDEVPVFKTIFDKYFLVKKAKIDKMIDEADDISQ